MTSTVADILQSIDALSQSEKQELVMALCDGLRPTDGHRVTIDEPLEFALGADPVFALLDTDGKRELLRQKLLSGLEQVKQGRVTDGEVVFDRLQAKLRQMSEQQA
jgi:antitoxin ParD1/3/4